MENTCLNVTYPKISITQTSKFSQILKHFTNGKY